MFFIFGLPIWVAAILLIAIILIFEEVEHERASGATVVIAATLGILHYYKFIDLTVAPQHWGAILSGIGLWLVAGVLWAMSKWKFFVDAWARTQRERLADLRTEFLDKLNLKGDTVPNEHKDAWVKFLQGYITVEKLKWTRDVNGRNEKQVGTGEFEEVKTSPRFDMKSLDKALSVKEHKGRIVLWGVYWPFSLIWTVVDDPIRRAYEYILVVVIGGTLHKIGRGAVDSVTREVTK